MDLSRMETPVPNPDPASAAPDLVPALHHFSPQTRSIAGQLLQLLAIAAMAVACYFLISRFFVQSVTVVGSSMSPTLVESERYLLNRWVYHFRAPRRNDLVVLRDPADNGCSVKRIVALEGESVQVRNGHLYVNGQKVIEPFLLRGTVTLAAHPRKEQTFTCGPGQYFVLGDNRNNSVDSRAYGPVPREKILGLVIR